MIKCERFSSLLRLLRVTAYLSRFIHNLKCNRENRKSKHLSVVDLKEARNVVVKLIQEVNSEYWKAEIEEIG